MPPYLKAKIAEGAHTFEDVEQIHRVSRSEQYELIRDGKITARKLGHRTLINLPSVGAHIELLPDAKLAPSKPPKRKAVQA